MHSDGSNSDYSAIAGPPDVELAWDTYLGGRINLGPTSGPDGQIYATTGTATCALHALDPQTGAQRWCSSEVDLYAAMSSPLVDLEGNLYLADSQAMHAFTPEGDVRWETPIRGVPLSAQFTQNGRVLIITNIGVVYVFYREDGRLVVPPLELIGGATFDPAKVQACARGTVDCPVANTPAIDLRTGTIVTTFWRPGAAQAEVLALKVTESPAPSLQVAWSNASLPGGSASSPTISADGSRVYVNDNVDALHALDLATGEEIWSFPIGWPSGGSPSVTPEGLIMPSGGAASPVLAVRDEGDHATLAWKRADLVNRGIPTQTAGGRSYATVANSGFVNDLIVLDTEDGSTLDREPLPGTTLFSVGTTVAQDGTVLVPTLTGHVMAFRAPD